MIALAIVLGVVVLLLAVLVAGLLRSHADILTSLHDLGVGVGDPSGEQGLRPQSGAAAVTMGPSLPAGRDSSSVPTIAGVTPAGDALAVAPAGSDRLTLLAFLSSGCASCTRFWEGLGAPGELGLPARTRLLVVTKGPDREIAAEVAAQTPPGLSVVMSSEAWTDYEVPGSPFFVLVDGRAGRRVGEGVAHHVAQLAELVRRAEVDAGGDATDRVRRPVGIDGPGRESANDRELADAGIRPGDPSLYPASLEDIFGPAGPVPAATHRRPRRVR